MRGDEWSRIHDIRIAFFFFFFLARRWDGVRHACIYQVSGYDLFADNESSLKHFGAAGRKPRHLN